jgi:hypothetical protein
MIESRCRKTGAIFFSPSADDLETINIKKENKMLKERMEALEILVSELMKTSNS